MAIDKNKIIEAATKFVQKGQYDKAIKEYQKLLEVDPKDARIQQKLGELYQKKGDNTLAADCFLKVAESYAADGFFLKAVAVYKQVLKLNPNLVDVNLKLAELHQQLGLMSDAMAQFQLVANHYEKSGNIRASLDTLRKMVDLDPENVASRIKLAELYARENMNPDAIAEFGRAAEYLKRNNRVDDYIKVAERLVFLDPNNLDLTRELANIYLTKQDTKRALAKLQICFKADPKDVETLTMLAQAFKDLGQIAKTVSVFKELAKIYDEQDRVDEERETWRKIQDLAPEDPDVRARFATAAPASHPVAAAPQQAQAAPAARPAQAAAPAPKPAADQIPRLLTETDVYVKYGLHEKAIEHLKKVFAIDPDSVDAHEKAADLYAASGNVQGALDSLVRVVRTCIARGELDRARVALQKLCEKEPTHPEIPGFLNAVGGLAPVEEVAEIEEDAILVEAVDEAIEVAPEPEHPVDLAAVSIANSDDAALDAAAESLASEEPSGEGPELLAESAPPEEELIAGPTDDALALSSAESSPELVEQEPLVDPGFEEPALEPLPEEPQDLAPAEAEEQAFAAQQQEDVEIEHSSAEFAIPPEEQVLAEDLGEQSGQLGDQEELGEALEGPDAQLDAEQELHPTMPGRQTMPAAARRQPDEEDEHEEATRVADLPMLLMQSAGPREIRKTGSMEPLQPEEGQPLDEGTEDEPTSVLPALKAKSPESPKTQPNLRNAQEVLDAAKASSAATPVPGLGKPAKVTAKPAAKPEPVKVVKPEPEPEPEPEAEEEGAQDELDESAFFMDQGMLEEAREILETVMLAYPGSARAKELMARLEELEAGGAATTGETETPAAESEAPALVETTTDGAFDLASELAKEDLGDLGGPIAPATDDFQVSVEDVFGEFKKGLKKVVKPEDVETHFDLGIAYKEMGLIDDAIGEFEQAAAAAAGKKKELEALAMVGTCQVERDSLADAAEAFQRALALPQVTPDVAKAVQFDLALVFEKMGRQGEALALFRKVQKTDPDFRRVGEAVDRLVADGVEEPPAKPARPANGSTASKGAVKPDSATGPEKADPKAGGTGKRAGKIGYV